MLRQGGGGFRGGGQRTRLVALPDEAGGVCASECNVAVEAVVAQVGNCSLVPLHVDGAPREIEVEADVALLPLQPATHSTPQGTRNPTR